MKILYVTTVSSTVNVFFISHIKMLKEEGHEVDIAFNIDFDIKPEIKEMGCREHILPFQRSPLTKDNFKAFKMLKKIIVTEGYDLIHTHTPVASTIVRLACRNLSNVKVFYTAHGFHFYKEAPLKNWLIYYPIEKWLSRYTDTLITINKEDYERAKNKFKAKKVNYIPGVGLDVEKFRNVLVDRKAKREKIGVPENSFVVLSVGELNKNKNHEVVIKAIAKLNNPKIHYVVCGIGPLENYLKSLAEEKGIEEQVHLLGFRNDVADICKASDLFAFPSLREGLGMASLEAMACGLPIVTSNVHGIVDYSIDGVTGYTNDPKDIDGFSNSISTLLENNHQLLQMSKNNITAVDKYATANIIKELLKIYNYGVNVNGKVSINNNTDI